MWVYDTSAVRFKRALRAPENEKKTFATVSRQKKPTHLYAPVNWWRYYYRFIIIVYYAEAAENIKRTHTIHAYTTKQFKHTNKNTYYVKSMR